MNILSYKKRIVGKYKMQRKVASIWGVGLDGIQYIIFGTKVSSLYNE